MWTEETRVALQSVQGRRGFVRVGQFPGPRQVHSTFGHIKALVNCPVFALVAQMPLAEIAGRITVLLERLCDSLFIQFQVMCNILGITCCFKYYS